MSEADPASPPVTASVHRKDVAEIGADLRTSFYAATKLGGQWGYDSKVSREAITGLVAALRENAAASGKTSLRAANEQVFLNGQRLRMDLAGFIAFRHIIDLFTTRDIGEIRITAAASERDVIGLLRALNGVARDSDDPRGDVERALASEGAAAVSVVALHELGDDDKLLAGMRDTSIASYFRAVFVASRITAEASGGLDGRKAKRVVHDMADALERDETTLLALAQIKNFGAYRATHQTNVAVLSMAVARRLGMQKTMVGEIGVAAYLHEVDCADDDKVAGASDKAPDDRARRRARGLLKRMGYGDGSLRLLLAALHPREPVTGPGGRAVPLVHRIIRVVDFYDAATTPAGPGRAATPPHRALRLLARDPQRFDTRVVKTLAAVVGLLPYGTVVRLDTGESAVVCGRNPHFDAPGRPIVKLTTDAQGEPLAEQRNVDLSTWNRDANKFARSIVEASSPSEVYEKPADYLATI